jgi:hypothetical protein
MASDSTTYLPGQPPSKPRPLARYLPPIAEGIASSFLRARLPSKADGQELPWVLDPFGAAPWLAVEMAQAGYRVLVAANNPVGRFLLEMAADPPALPELRAALAELAAARKGEERLEPHIRSLYQTTCNECGQEVMAEAFLWDRGVPGNAGSGPVPYAKVYNCPQCNASGEYPVTDEDIARAAQFSATGLHRARALERGFQRRSGPVPR